MKANIKSILTLIALVLTVVIVVTLFSSRVSGTDKFTYGEMKELLKNDFVISLEVDAQLNAKITALSSSS